MIATNTPLDQPNRLADQAAQSADHAIRSTQRITNHALDSLAASVQDMRHEATPLLNRASGQASAIAHRGLDAIRESSHQLSEKTHHASDSTVHYIKEQPLKAMLIAAATGAALMAVVSVMSRSRDRA